MTYTTDPTLRTTCALLYIRPHRFDPEDLTPRVNLNRNHRINGAGHLVPTYSHDSPEPVHPPDQPPPMPCPADAPPPSDNHGSRPAA